MVLQKERACFGAAEDCRNNEHRPFELEALLASAPLPPGVSRAWYESLGRDPWGLSSLVVEPIKEGKGDKLTIV